MPATPANVILNTGFEWGLASPASGGGGLCSGYTGSDMSVQSSVKRSGNYALKANTSASNSFLRWAMTSENMVVGRLYFLYEVTPTASGIYEIVRILSSSTYPLKFRYDYDSNNFYCGFYSNSSDTIASMTLNLNNWYRLDFRMNLQGNPHTCDWAINGVNQTQATRALATATANNFSFGPSANCTQIAYCDDMILSNNSDDYPIGEGQGEILVPVSDKTYSFSANEIESNDAVDISVSNPGWSYLDDIPVPGATGDRIQQNIANASAYLEVEFSNTTHNNINGVRAVAGWIAANTTGSNAATYVHIPAGTPSNATVYSGNMANTSWCYRAAVINPTGENWTPTLLNNVSGMIGFGDNVTTRPAWQVFFIEVDGYNASGFNANEYIHLRLTR